MLQKDRGEVDRLKQSYQDTQLAWLAWGTATVVSASVCNVTREQCTVQPSDEAAVW